MSNQNTLLLTDHFGFQWNC